jgi:tetratricopeptide (TPR) repeat protein
VTAYETAERAFREAVALNDRSSDGLTGLGWALVGQGKYAEALETLNQSLAITEQADAHFGIGWAQYQQALYPEAEAAFLRAIELRPNDGGNHYWFGLTLREQGRIDEAREALQTAVELGNPFAQAALDALE